MNDQPRTCPKCGNRNRPGVSFCVGCGTPLETRSEPDAASGRGRLAGRGRATIAIATAIAVLTGGILTFAAITPVGAGSDVIIYEPPLAGGNDPFTSPVDVSAASVGAEIPAPASPAALFGLAEPDAEIGAGPFGGTGEDTVCDRELLIRSLEARPDRLRAWASVRGIAPADVPDYIRSLRPATLSRDWRVTNHTFVDGRAVPLQYILPAGTAVLVDEDGQVVVRCRCGNPLKPPIRVRDARCENCPPDYAPPPPRASSIKPPVVHVVNPPPVQETEATGGTDPGDIGGTWNLQLDGCDGSFTVRLDVFPLAGTIVMVASREGISVPFSGSVDDDGSFRAALGAEGIVVSFAGRFDGSRLTGSIRVFVLGESCSLSVLGTRA